ncbi:MAG: UDP-N-acetylglucosamine diphosphorylase/glucosamine-phosphate N-acetyltransferase [Caulobacter sp.]|jgi:bifunctional UDP-N-acetylglucosamine pyrophosphorylase/glucosamine-1-phosphate N-acetyltransferase|nr:UDP-N-acetylglucosamine diphosphorylase/glucosamine-phosphate N-acetyltransferase [Caulobacter sp.]
MSKRAAVIMAAGQGTRMKSPTPKVLHEVGGRTMLDRAIDAAQGAGCERIVVVCGTHSPAVAEHVKARLGPDAVAVQDPPMGTAHAVLCAKDALAGFEGEVLVTNADCPLLTAADLEPLFGKGELTMLAFEPADPALYGRMIQDADGRLLRIVEARDATPEELAVRSCYSGMLACPAGPLFDWLARIDNDNVKAEYYITGIVGVANAAEARVGVATVSETAVMGADDQAGVARAEYLWQQRRRGELMAQGVSMVAPETVFLAWDTQIAGGAVIEPNVVFGPRAVIEAGAVIRAFSHVEGAIVRSGAIIGPYARLRPGADIGENAHIGNFVEVKKVKVGKGAKANHLAYLGDGTIGEKANIGAGTIFCNYDGFDKFDTHVGAGAFIGSNSSLVAPVSVGAGAMTGSGSVITKDVPEDDLGLARAEQVNKPGWSARFRAAKQRAKAAK